MVAGGYGCQDRGGGHGFPGSDGPVDGVEFVESRAFSDADSGRPYLGEEAVGEALLQSGGGEDRELLSRRYWIRYWATLRGPMGPC